MSDDDLRALFLAGSPADRPVDDAALGAGLRAHIDAGRAAWPELAVDDAAFVRFLALGGEASLPRAAYAADLWLACACSLGVNGAAVAFERAHRATIERAVARVSRDATDEVTQAVMVSLLVSDPGSAPRIAEFRGRATLRTWLSTVAANAALNLVQRRDNQPHATLGGLDVAVAEVAPELALAKARHAADLEAALREALASLDQRRRVLLRLHHVKGWTVDRLATMYRVSRSAAGRLLQDARAALLEDVKKRLRERLKLTQSELESLVAVLQSDLDVSLFKALGEENE